MNNLHGEVLIDHTSLHSLLKRQTASEDIIPRSRELFTFIENILLSDVIWICDTVTPQTMEITDNFLNMFLNHGLANSRADGKFRVGNFSEAQILKACENASREVFEYLGDLNLRELYESGDSNAFQVRPVGAQFNDFDKIAQLPFRSELAKEYINKCLEELGWLPSSCLPLLDSNLYRWFSKAYQQAGTYRVGGLIQFNTICRWKINEELAKMLSIDDSCINYVPSYGRAKTLDTLNKYQWQKNLNDLEIAVNAAIRNDSQLKNLFRELSPTLNYPLPVLGMWIASKLPANPVIEDLIVVIAEHQQSKIINRIKENLFSEDDLEIREIQREITSELRYNQKKRGKSDLAYEAVIKIPIIPKILEFQAKGSKRYPSPDLFKWVRQQFNNDLTTILSGFVEDIVGLEQENQQLFFKTQNLLCL